jgi:hypothetical protein
MSARGGLWVDEPEKALDQLGPLLSLPITCRPPNFGPIPLLRR